MEVATKYGTFLTEFTSQELPDGSMRWEILCHVPDNRGYFGMSSDEPINVERARKMIEEFKEKYDVTNNA